MSRLIEQAVDAANKAAGDRPEFFMNMGMGRAAVRATINGIGLAVGASMNLQLCEMKEGSADSIVGFNQAWDVVRDVLAELAEKAQSCVGTGTPPVPLAKVPSEPEDFAWTAKLLRAYCNDSRSQFYALCSNNLNIILAALDAASEDLKP